VDAGFRDSTLLLNQCCSRLSEYTASLPVLYDSAGARSASGCSGC
jgi:hypothetical protein